MSAPPAPTPTTQPTPPSPLRPGSQGPFIHPIPIFSPSLAFFPTLPEAEIPHRSHSNVRLSHGAPPSPSFFLFFHFNTEQPPPPPPATQVLVKHAATFLLEQEASGESLGKDVRGSRGPTRRGCRRPVSTKNQSHSPITGRGRTAGGSPKEGAKMITQYE